MKRSVRYLDKIHTFSPVPIVSRLKFPEIYFLGQLCQVPKNHGLDSQYKEGLKYGNLREKT